jgi:hypothetical protein
LTPSRDSAPGERESFYAAALGGAERAAELAEARAVEGIEDEVALLRLRLRDALEQHPDDFRLLQSGVRLLIQSLLARRRLSPKQADDLADAVSNVLEQITAAVKSADEV